MPPPIRPMTLQDFCITAKSLLAAGRHGDFVKMVINGIYDDHQVVVDPVVDTVDEYESTDGARDLDSAFGISSQIRVSTQLTVYPVPKHEDTLTRDVHLKYRFVTSQGSLYLPIHKVPNLCLGKWSIHTLVRVLLPAIHTDRRSPELTQEEKAIFYEKGLRPAIANLTHITSSEWPATYSDEMFRARGPNGQLSFCSKVVAEWLVPELGNAIRDALTENGCTWGTGLVFLHQVRGVKHSSTHGINRESAKQAVEIFLRDNHLTPGQGAEEGEEGDDEADGRGGEKWWVDAAIEVISNFGNCLAWRTDSHSHIVRRALSISYDEAERITKPGSTLYARDLVSHLTAVSGCRITPGKAHGLYDAVYMQLYTTDKALIYRPDGTAHGKYIKTTEIIAGKGPKFVENLIQLYNNAISTCSSHARLEVRVPLEEAHRVLLNFDDALIRESLVSINPKLWWTLRSLRATGFKFIIEWQSQGYHFDRSRPSALLLTSASSIMLSSLHSTFDLGSSTRELMRLILPHVRRAGADPDILAYGSVRRDGDDSDDEEMVSEFESSSDSEDEDAVAGAPRVVKRRGPSTAPANPYGLVFLLPIKLGGDHPVPRFDESGGIGELSQSACMFFFGKPDFSSIRDSFRNARISAPVNKDRVRNKISRAPVYHNHGQNPAEPIFQLREQGARIPRRPRDRGSDIEEDDDREETDANSVASNLWHRFCQDVTTVSPNQQDASKTPYTRLTQGERTVVTENTYKNPTLSDYFYDCQWKYASPLEWSNNFGYFFPERHQPPRNNKCQNYFRTNYFPEWEELKQRVDHNTYRLIRRALKSRFDKLYWMPSATKERIWWTKKHDKMVKISGIDRSAPSPRVLVNSTAANPPRW